MRRGWMAVPAVWLLVIQASAGEPPRLETQKEKASYTLGVESARNLKRQGLDVDIDVLIQGLRDGASGGKLLLTDQELGAARNALQKELMRKQAAQKQKRAQDRMMSTEENRKAGMDDAEAPSHGRPKGVE